MYCHYLNSERYVIVIRYDFQSRVLSLFKLVGRWLEAIIYATLNIIQKKKNLLISSQLPRLVRIQPKYIIIAAMTGRRNNVIFYELCNHCKGEQSETKGFVPLIYSKAEDSQATMKLRMQLNKVINCDI